MFMINLFFNLINHKYDQSDVYLTNHNYDQSEVEKLIYSQTCIQQSSLRQR